MVTIGELCPTSAAGTNPGVSDCSTAPAIVRTYIFKLKPGTSLKEFYDGRKGDLQVSNDLMGRKNVETNKIKISGLSAIQRIDTIGGGSFDKSAESFGNEPTKRKEMDSYVVNGNLGYWFSTATNEDDFEMYLPIFEDMLNFVRIK